MRQYERVDKTVRQDRIVSITCDRCGKECLQDEHFMEGTHVTLDFGYGSTYDLETWYFDLCDGCCGELKQFVGDKIEIEDKAWRP